jgi:acyl dehydratase
MATSTFSSLTRLARVAARRPPGLVPGASLPSIEVTRHVVVDAGWLARYRALVGAAADGVLPPCAPQVLAIDLHLQILQDPRFPFAALGMVHVDNVIEERRALPETGTLELRVCLGEHRPHDKGTTFDLVTEARVLGDEGPPPWRSVMTALVRDRRRSAPSKGRSSSSSSSSSSSNEHGPLLTSSAVFVPADLGRRYAAVAGDANPIHLWATTAKLFGFPRAIAHGMWTLARSLAEVSSALPPMPRRTSVKFIRPVLLPQTIWIESAAASSGLSLRVRPERAGPPHLVASIQPQGADAASERR